MGARVSEGTGGCRERSQPGGSVAVGADRPVDRRSSGSALPCKGCSGAYRQPQEQRRGGTPVRGDQAHSPYLAQTNSFESSFDLLPGNLLLNGASVTLVGFLHLSAVSVFLVSCNTAGCVQRIRVEPLSVTLSCSVRYLNRIYGDLSVQSGLEIGSRL